MATWSFKIFHLLVFMNLYFACYRHWYVRPSLPMSRQSSGRVLGHENPVHGRRHSSKTSGPRHEWEEHTCWDKSPFRSQFVSIVLFISIHTCCLWLGSGFFCKDLITHDGDLITKILRGKTDVNANFTKQYLLILLNFLQFTCSNVCC